MSELESTQELSRSAVADYLREFAAQLDTASPGGTEVRGQDDSRVTFLVGDDSATIDPPETMTFEVEVETDHSLVGSEVEHEVEFELSWTTEASDESDEAELDIV